MKNFTCILSVAALSLAAFSAASFSSCKNRPAALAPVFAAIDKTHNLATTTGNFEVMYHFEYLSALSDPAVLQKVQSAMASDFFGPTHVKTDAAATAAAFDASLQSTYGVRADSSAFRWDGYLHLHSKATLVGSHLVSYTVERGEDSGGAHVMQETRCFTYNLLTGARLTLSDLFTPEGKAALADLIRARILKDKGAATWDEIVARDCFNAASEVAPTDNFALTAADITFVYNPYDIACYAAGATKVTLPLANLAGFKKELLNN